MPQLGPPLEALCSSMGENLQSHPDAARLLNLGEFAQSP